MVKEFIGKLNGIDGLGAISQSAQAAIRQNSGAIAKVLRKAQRLNGLAGLGKADSNEVVSMQESIETLNKENGLMNDDEIRAWVYYKRSLGVPMTGWEKYFTKGTGNNEKLLTTIDEAEIKDKNFVTLKVVPAGVRLGQLCEKKESVDWYFFTDKTGAMCMVAKRNVRISKNPYEADQKEIDKMVTDGVLFYNNGRYLPYAVYVYANSYDRIIELDEDKEYIEKHYGKRVYENHKKVIDECKPKQLSFLDPIKENRPQLSPFSKYAQDFEILEVDEKAPFELRVSEGDTGVSLTDAYESYLRSQLPRELFQYPNIQGGTIINVCYYKARQPRGWDKEDWETLKGRCFAECVFCTVVNVFAQSCRRVA